MGNIFSRGPIENCVISRADFNMVLKYINSITPVIDKLSGSFQDGGRINSNIKFEKIPVEMQTITEAKIDRADTEEQNAIVRYNAFISLFKEIDHPAREERAKEILEDLVSVREKLLVTLYDLC